MTASKTEGGSRIGELLLSTGLISEQQLNEALDYQKQCDCKLGSALVALGAIEEKILAAFLAMQRGIKAIHLAERAVSPDVLALLAPVTARRLGAIPLERDGDVLKVAMVDPGDEDIVRALEAETGLRVRGYIAPQTSIHAALKRFYPDGGQGGQPHPPDLRQIRRQVADARRLLEAIERELSVL
jgi:hypothetical protein